MSSAPTQTRTAEQQGTARGAERAALLEAVRRGLGKKPYTLPAWLFYDERGSALFEQITELPEYYLTRTERGIFERYADTMLDSAAGEIGRQLAFLELGAGTATKTGVLLQAAARRQERVRYVPVDVSASALEEATRVLTESVPGLVVEPQVANYLRQPIRVRRPPGSTVLALYIGSSIGNFEPSEARGVLRHLRSQLLPGDALLLGTDLAPAAGVNGASAASGKSIAMLLAAYDDSIGVTAAFNRNMLHRLNRDLGTEIDVSQFAHEARWNENASRIEMHLVAQQNTELQVPTSRGEMLIVPLRTGESIHTENSYKYNRAAVEAMLTDGGWSTEETWVDDRGLFAVTLARAV